jgi:hypothetical protein
MNEENCRCGWRVWIWRELHMRGYCFFFKRMEERWALLTDYLEATDLLLKRGDEKCGCDVNAVNRITGGHWSSSEKNRWRVQMSDELCCQYSARQVTDLRWKEWMNPDVLENSVIRLTARQVTDLHLKRMDEEWRCGWTLLTLFCKEGTDLLERMEWRVHMQDEL